jgi:ketosteroid isomerase-like protein
MRAQTPGECEELFTKHLNTGNVDELLSLYDSEASHVRSDGTVAHGHAAIRPVLEEFAAMGAKLEVRLKKTVEAGDHLAIVYDDWKLTGPGPDGPTEMSGKGVHIVSRQPDGGWLYVVTGVTNAEW